MEKARKFCLEMLQQRKYEIIEDKKEHIILKKPNSKNVIVYFANFAKFNVKNIQIYMSNMNELDIEHAIIIYKDTITPFTKKAIEKSSMIFEMFAEENLQYNITKHKYQPKFEKLSDKDTVEFKKKFNTKFPIIKKDDPISLFYNYQKGDIIKIIRKSGFVTYRIVK